MPIITVIDPSHVTIDGVPAGTVLDVPENHSSVEGIKSLVLDALIKWDVDRNQATISAIHATSDAALESAKVASDLHAEAIAAQGATHKSELDAKDETIARLEATIADQLGLINVLGGTELGQRLAKNIQIKMTQDILDKAKADLDRLKG